MASSQKTVVTAFMAALATVLFVPSAFAVAADAPEPVVVWDGSTLEYNFSNRTRTVDDNIYMLNLHENTLGDKNSYILIGANQKAGVTITATNINPSVINAFGEWGEISVIMKCSGMNLSDNTFRGVIGLLADEGGYYFNEKAEGDNNVKVGLATGYNTSNGAGSQSHFFKEGVYYASSANSRAFTTGRQTICLTYASGSGTHVYRDGMLIASEESVTLFNDWLTPAGIVLGGVDKDGSSRAYAQTGMKIEAVAVFTSALSPSDVANYTFPSDANELNVESDTAISDINAQFPGSEIDLYIANGVTITGDASFNASKVNFHCAGSFTLTPPTNNTATFDFSGVVGQPIIRYDGVLPTVKGSYFTSNAIPEFVTEPAQWTGTIWLRNVNVTDFTVNPFGNESSVVRLTGITGWLATRYENGSYNVDGAFTNAVPVELSNEGSSFALTLDNGISANTSYPNRCTVFKKVFGSGSLYAQKSATTVVVVIQNASGFTGGIGMDSSKIVVFGETMPPQETLVAGSIVVMEGASVKAQPSAAHGWWATGGITVHGELRADSLEKFGGGTSITTSDDGVFTLSEVGNREQFGMDYSRLSRGTGTLNLEGSNWVTLPTNDTISANLTLRLSRLSGVVIPPGGVTVNNVSGSGNLRSDFVSGLRDLVIVQSKDTEWSGVFAYADRVAGVYVRPGVSSSGTLTLSGVQTHSNDLVVETNATVNLTGTWVGPVNVDGTISGTGTVDGDLTLTDGATLKVNDLSGALAVSGAFTATGAISIELPEGALSSSKRKCMLLSSTGSVDLSGATFTLTVGGEPVKMSDYGFSIFRGRLMLKRNGSVYSIR